MIIDTHCHLDSEKYFEDLDGVLQRGKEKGVQKVVIPGADITDLPRAIELAEKYECVYFAVGFHPYDINAFSLEPLEQYHSHPKCVAIGECGLDYYRLPKEHDEKEEEKKLQKEVFIAQIEFAKKVQKPLIVHIRDASLDSKNILVEHEAYKVGGVLHCYNADEQLLSLAKMGFYYGIGGVLTFSNARKLVEVLPKIPKERLVLETDGPYLTPTPHRGTRNEPAYLEFVVKKMEELLGIRYDEICELTTKNSEILFFRS